MNVLRFPPLPCSLGFVVLTVLSVASAAEKPIDFNREIRPILSDICFKCHGPDEKERQAGLRLDKQEGAIAKLETGKVAVVPGKSAESSLIARLTTNDASEKMPPPASGKKLSPQQIELFRKWIDQGAEYRGHWSFQPIARPEPPVSKEPVSKEAVAGRNAIDRFVQTRLESEGLRPTSPADKITLIRRLTFDLTGLPPTPAEVNAFLADNSPNVYESLVDRLFKSPRYGEHMARYWLDVARYGDTHGLHLDNERSLWLYREWVINAFNKNMPFDQFTVEQIAGDLLPNATLDQRIATGFNRCNVSTSEGGSIDEEVRVRYAVDRTETLGTVFMGLTLGCAVCHDHKFDPLTQKEFYSLLGFYNSTADAAMDGNALLPPPVIKVMTSEITGKLKDLDGQIAKVQQSVRDEVAKAAASYTDPTPQGGETSSQPFEFVWFDDDLPAGAKPQGTTPWQFVSAPKPVFSGSKASTRTSKGLSQHFFDSATVGLKIGEGDKLFAYVYLDPLEQPKEIMLQFNDGVWEHRAYWGENVIPWGIENSASRVAMGPLPEVGKWVRLEVDAAKVGLPPGAVVKGWAFTQHDGTCYWDKAGIVTRTPQDGKERSFDSLAAWEGFERTLTKSTVPANILQAIKADAAARNDDQKKLIREYFVERIFAGTRLVFDPLLKQVETLTKQKADLENTLPSTMVMADVPQPRETFLLIRGAYNKRGDKVQVGVPAVLPPLPKDAPANRLGLAKWLVDPSHPLTARVTVNRFWQNFFGRGLVKTSEDFGSQGEWPSHPELLDWLSAEFMQSGWDVQHLQKLMLMSATYQQSSRVTPELIQRDPENMLLARGPRFRLDAEVVRDSTLAVSGLLVEKTGGKSVKTYQPPGLWEAVAFVGSTTQNFKRDAGEALYRRSMYTFWKRTSPPPALTTFDAPSRENCAARRPRTNTPLQALALMNDEQYVEASRHLARRMLTEAGPTPESRLAFGFRLATARPPEPAELDTLIKLHADQLAHYQANKDGAMKLLSVGESKRDESLDVSEYAAWTMMANLILNLDEAITKE